MPESVFPQLFIFSALISLFKNYFLCLQDRDGLRAGLESSGGAAGSDLSQLTALGR